MNFRKKSTWRKLLIIPVFSIISNAVSGQCYYVPAYDTTSDSLSYHFAGGHFGSYGCAPVDPTYWMTGSGDSVTITFSHPRSHPSFRVWGMNSDDSAVVLVNGVVYHMDSGSASFYHKVVCGISPGFDGVSFANGKVFGTHDNIYGNYSYQDVSICTSGVTSFTVTGINGMGWGFAGVTLNCPCPLFDSTTLGIAITSTDQDKLMVYPNPARSEVKIESGKHIDDGVLNICNMLGRVVRSVDHFNGYNMPLSLDGFPGGVYVIQLVDKGIPIATGKIVVY